MKPLSLTLLAGAAALALAQPAVAQDHSMMPGMNMPGMKMPAPKKTVQAKKPTAKKPTAKKATSKTTAPSKRSPATKPAAKRFVAPAKKTDLHAGHDMSTMPGLETPTGHDMSTMPGMDMPAGHDMNSMPGTEMPAGHDMSSMENIAPTGTDLPAGNAPPPPVPAARAADAVYSDAAMHMGVHHLNEFHGGQKFTQIMFNIAEVQFRKGRDGFEWDGEGWYGGDINRLWVKSEGDGAFGRSIDRAEVQALYSRAVGPYFNLQGGLRYDFKPNPSRVYATVGFEGLAPSFFDVEGALFLSNKGELLARAEGYYDQRITQRLILQPRAELNFAAQDTRETLTGSGLSDAEVGLRLRYDIRREFAPYVGVQYRRAFGDTRRYLREAGEDANDWSLLTGIRGWF
ncbi:MAG: copper resistance protein B [Sphingomonas sp.]|uniref:copper resistance protein B n=1 Tax=Sphingomonas sp. TaxID=28214 RepID=UPI00183DC765|nr:copper resistance protein B [Sphingomonas sp.]MBA3666627.1 copper resistance protein B [Sphingomonas sp.]